MLRHTHCLIAAMAIMLTSFVSAPLEAATIWSGPLVSFTKAPLADPSLPANQDSITDNVWITRDNTQGIFNIKTEASYSNSVSPADTEWAWDLSGLNTGLNISAANFANLTFSVWRTATGNSPPSIANIPGVLHLITDDIYIDIEFTSWSQGGGGGGGFSYRRSTAPPVPEPTSIAIVALGAMLVSAKRRNRND